MLQDCQANMELKPDLPPNGGSTPALRRAVQALDLVGASATPLAAADIGRALGIPKSTAHGLLSTMVELGLLTRSDQGLFRLGSHLMQWANGFLNQTNLVEEFRRHFALGGDLDSHTVTFTVLERTEVMYLDCRNSGEPLGLTFRIGMRLPAAFTATGKAMLATLADKDVAELLSNEWPDPMTGHSVNNVADLLIELGECRRHGYSVDNGQIRESMTCIGAAVRDHSGRGVAGIAISLIQSEASNDIIESIGKRISSAASELSARLGFRKRLDTQRVAIL